MFMIMNVNNPRNVVLVVLHLAMPFIPTRAPALS